MTEAPLSIALLGIGSSVHITRLAADLAARQHQVHVISEDRHGPFPALTGVRFHPYAWNRRFPLRVANVRSILRTIQPDVLHSHYINIGGYVGVASGFHPHVITGWGSDVYVVPYYSKSQWFKTGVALRSADWILSPARAMQTKMNEIAGALKHNEVLPWGLDTRHFAPCTNRNEFKQRHGLRTNAPLALSARAVQPIYNQDVLLRAWPKVLERFPEAQLAFIRFNADPDYEAQVRALADQLKIAKSVVWLESLSFHELPAAYSAADVMVSIPTTDAPALTVMEAMACGTPVVVSDIPALHELVHENEHGFLVDVKNPASIGAGIINGFALTPMERTRMASVNRNTIVTTAERQICLDRLESIYRRFGRPAGFSFATSVRNIIRGAS